MSERVKWLDETCNVCGAQLNSWDVRCSKALAYKNHVCEKCIAKEYDMEVDALREKLEHVFGLRPCMGI
jgi:predicted amidophosphoribosyltransferase